MVHVIMRTNNNNNKVVKLEMLREVKTLLFHTLCMFDNQALLYQENSVKIEGLKNDMLIFLYSL